MDRKAFEILARQIRPRLETTAIRILHDDDEAADAVQDTLLKMWIARHKLQQAYSITALGDTICRRICIDRLRRTNKTISGIPFEKEDDSPGQIEIIENKEIDEYVKHVFSKLPEGQQLIIRLKHIEGMETEDIAKLTGSSVTAIRMSLSRARKHIKQIFTDGKII